MSAGDRNPFYGIKTDLIFDLSDLKFKRREKSFLPDNEVAVFTQCGAQDYRFTFSKMRMDEKIEFLNLTVAEFNMPHINQMLDAYAKKYGFSVEWNLNALTIDEKKYNNIKETLE